MKKTQNSTVKLLTIAIFQIAIWPLVALVAFIYGKNISVYINKDDIKKDEVYIIAASHGNMFDPFLLLRHLPFTVFIKLIPVRFFAYNGLIDSPYGFLLRALGSFPAKEHKKYLHGINAATMYVKDKQTVQIFPEGKRNRGKVLPARPGVAILASQPNVKVILVDINWKKNKGKLGYDMIISKPIDCNELNSEQIMQKIRHLSIR